MFDIETLPIKIIYAGEVPCPWSNSSVKVDQWIISLSDSNSFWSTNYFTGLGLRGPRSERVRDGGPEPRRNTLMWERLEASRKPVMPTKRQVLESFFLDAGAGTVNFDDWCDNYGYSNDSIKSLNTYKACLGIYRAINKYFDTATRKAIEVELEEA